MSTLEPEDIAARLFDQDEPDKRACDLHLDRTLPVRKMPAEVRRWVSNLDESDRVFRDLVERGYGDVARLRRESEDVQSAVQTLASQSAHRTAMASACDSGEGLFYATSEFTTLLAGAWPSIPLDSLTGVPPVGTGVVYLQQPLPLQTAQDPQPFMVRSISWTVLQPTRKYATPLLVVWAQAYDQQWRIGRSEMARVAPREGTDGSEPEHYDVQGTTVVGQIGLAAMLLLQQDNLVSAEQHEPSPAQRKARGRKAQHEREPVKVVRLRKATRRGMEEAHAAERSERHTRWIVRGHWRQQACGKGRQDRRRIYIAPHYKGPEDGTLVVRDTVFQW